MTPSSDMRHKLLAVALFASACSTPPPEERPCLHCAELSYRLQEAFLCVDSFATPYEPLHQCKCAPSAPCETACPIWCNGGDAGVAPDGGAVFEPTCTDCTAAMCAAQLAACRADQP